MLCRLSEISALQRDDVRYHLCIIGAGAAGIAIATRFVNAKVRVCLVESGGASPSARYQRLNEADSLGLEYDCVESRCRTFGGTLHVWGGRCGTLDPIDFEVRPWIPDSGWPIVRADLDPYYAKAVTFLGVPDGHALDTMPNDVDRRVFGARAMKDCFGLKQFLVVQYVNSRFCQSIRSDIAACSNITLVEDATAIELVQSTGDAVDAVVLRSLSAKEVVTQIFAETYVVCAGGLETPRLLLASRSRHETGIGNTHDLVGRFFMDHPRIRSLRFSPAVTMAPPKPAPATKQPFRRQFGFTLHRHIQEKYGLPNHTLFVGPTNADIASRATGIGVGTSAGRAVLARRCQERSTGIRTLRRLWRTMPPFVRSALEAARPSGSSRKFDVVTKIEQLPNRESRLFLSREKDRLGYAKICLDWRITSAERESIRIYQSLIRESLRREAAGETQIVFPDPEADGVYQDSSHPAGTTRMGIGPSSGVVDSDLRVFGVKNLYLCSSSVFPTAGSASPTLTIVALAIRLAEHLAVTSRVA